MLTTRRSLLSPAAPASQAEANLDYAASPQADRLVAQRSQAPATTHQPDPFERLRQLVRAFAPTACLRAFPLLEEDGVAPSTTTWHVQLSGPEVRQPVKAVHVNLAQLATDLKKKWAIERRATDVWRLVEECQRLVRGCLDEDFEAQLRYECTECRFSAFDSVAAKFRHAAANGQAFQLAA